MEKILWKIEKGSEILDIDRSFHVSIHEYHKAFYMIIDTFHYFENWEFNNEGEDEVGHYYQLGYKLNNSKIPMFYINVYLPEGFYLHINKSSKEVIINFFKKDFVQELKTQSQDLSMFIDLEADSREKSKNV